MKISSSKVIMVSREDLVITSMDKENVTINDFSGQVKKAAKTADLVIFNDEAHIKTILVFNNNLIEEPVDVEGVGAEA